MDSITFKYVQRIQPRFLEHTVVIFWETINCFILFVIFDWIFGGDISYITDFISSFFFGILGEFLRSSSKTIIDFVNMEVCYIPFLACPSLDVKFDEIKTIEIRKRWYYHCNVVITTKSGKKKKMSVDDTDLFISKLLEINDSINVINL